MSSLSKKLNRFKEVKESTASKKEEESAEDLADVIGDFVQEVKHQDALTKANSEAEEIINKSVEDDEVESQEYETLRVQTEERRRRMFLETKNKQEEEEEESIIDSLTEEDKEELYFTEPEPFVEDDEEEVEKVLEPQAIVVEEKPLEPVEPTLTRDSVMGVGDPVSNTTKESILASSAFQTVTGYDGPSPVSESFSEMIENMIRVQCELSGTTNLDLTTFGVRAQNLTFKTLTIREFGIHKFLGTEPTEEEHRKLLHELAVKVATHTDDVVVFRAAIPIKGTEGITYYSLLYDDKFAKDLATNFNYVVKINMHEVDLSKLVLVVYKK